MVLKSDIFKSYKLVVFLRGKKHSTFFFCKNFIIIGASFRTAQKLNKLNKIVTNLQITIKA